MCEKKELRKIVEIEKTIIVAVRAEDEMGFNLDHISTSIFYEIGQAFPEILKIPGVDTIRVR